MPAAAGQMRDQRAGEGRQSRFLQPRKGLGLPVALVEPATGGIEFLKMGLYRFSDASTGPAIEQPNSSDSIGPAAGWSWIDGMLIAGNTFSYTETGPVGLAGGKRVVIASSWGGL